MICDVLPADLFAPKYGLYVYEHLTHDDSDFQKKLGRWMAGETPSQQDGVIAVAIDQGEVVGWARTERWRNYNTLEAFVAQPYRERGIASWCASGLLTQHPYCEDSNVVAVFARPMVHVARRVGLHPVLYQYDDNLGDWVKP
jgi:hypothetical protein